MYKCANITGGLCVAAAKAHLNFECMPRTAKALLSPTALALYPCTPVHPYSCTPLCTPLCTHRYVCTHRYILFTFGFIAGVTAQIALRPLF